ncbi:hypothetical protein OSB04_021530 [Centaurea solstitialis]|uniref:Methyltransferase-like protein 13 n=1 Tax=Centaurea solstitialis TaxID=347529 RepID=A0AA38W6U3_9ASTR|nr:hypothetical protein OSB04_021530 [Centaurea solstitialis]
MALLDTSRLETLTPSQFFTFTLPNPLHHDCYLRGPFLRFAVLDSPNPTTHPIVAAMIVPAHRESDWIFSTESGHRHLLFSTCSNHISRFVLIGNLLQPNSPTNIYVRPPANPSADEEEEKRKLEMELNSLVIALHPKVCFQKGLPVPQFLTYEDNTVFRTTINTYPGTIVGEFLVEDVEVETKPGSKKDFRRRLRFKRNPNLIQTEVRITPTITTDGGGVRSLNLDLPSLKKMNQVVFKVDTSVLIPSYLNAMVSAIFLNALHLDSRIQSGAAPRVLCLGVGGGALLSFLNTRLGFQVVGVDCDRIVVAVAMQFFGLKNVGDSINIIDGDAVKLIEMVAYRLRQQNTLDLQVHVGWLDSKFDVLMVDLDASDPRYGICAPPPNFVTEPVFQTARSILTDHGIFVMNVVPLNQGFYSTLLQQLKSVFHKVYEMDVENEDNKVLVATLSPLPSHDHYNALSNKLKQVISEAYIDSIKEV